MKKISLWILLSLLLSGEAFAGRYRYYLSAERIQEQFAEIVLRPRIGQSEWLGILGDKKGGKYLVQPGDSLWRISQQVFGDPFLWRKLWQVNDVIQNPHEIEPGNLLVYYRSEGSDMVPVVKLRPPKRGVASDLEGDMVVNSAITARLRIPHFVVKDQEVLGEVTGSYTEKRMLGYLDDPYMMFLEKDKVKVGDLYSIAREETNIHNRFKGSLTNGTLMRLLGQVKVVEVGESLVKGEIVGGFFSIERGDKVVSVQKVVTRPGVFSPPEDMMATIVAADEPDHKLIGQGQLIVLNKGAEAGMQEGFYFRVYRDTDPKTNSQKGTSPASKGEVSIVYVAPEVSIGYVVRANDPILIGDVALSYRVFQDPPKRPHAESHQVSID